MHVVITLATPNIDQIRVAGDLWDFGEATLQIFRNKELVAEFNKQAVIGIRTINGEEAVEEVVQEIPEVA